MNRCRELLGDSEPLMQILYSLRLGDGSFVTQSQTTKNYYLMVSSVSLQYVSFKKTMLERFGVITQSLRESKSGFKSSSIIYSFGTRNHPLISKVASMSVKEVVSSLNKEGLSLYYLDDGTFHQKKHFGHLCCNTFTSEEVESLIDVLFRLYPIKRCSARYDRKKDGRAYPYVYIPVSVMREFKKDIKSTIDKYELTDFKYKIGEQEVFVQCC